MMNFLAFLFLLVLIVGDLFIFGNLFTMRSAPSDISVIDDFIVMLKDINLVAGVICCLVLLWTNVSNHPLIYLIGGLGCLVLGFRFLPSYWETKKKKWSSG